MNILDKLRRQSTEKRFLVTLTKDDATDLISYHLGEDSSAEHKAEYIMKFMGELNEPGGLNHIKGFTSFVPIEIDYEHQVLMSHVKLLAGFVLSNVNEISVYVSFVTNAPKTDFD